MVNPISAYLALPQGRSVVLYRNHLPQKQSLPFPIVKVSFDREEKSHYEAPRGQGDLCYDSQGFPTSFPKYGVFLDIYF